MSGYQVTKHLSAQRAKDILPSVLSAVGHIHEKELLHGDMAIANFLVTSKGRLLLSDFETTRHFRKTKSILWRLK